MSDHNGRVEQIVREAFRPGVDPLSVILTVRTALQAEHAAGWAEGHADGIRDMADAARFEREAADREGEHV